MSRLYSSVSLIGMPACGKSTVGRRLAAALGLRFIDGDALIEQKQGRRLSEILAEKGYLGLREVEEQALLSEDFHAAVLATGGSAVYSDAVMAALRRSGVIIFIDVPLDALRSRLGDFAARGVACPPGTGLDELFAERYPRYERAADIRIDATGLDEEALLSSLQSALRDWHNGDRPLSLPASDH